MLSEGSSGLWWGGGTTRVEAADARPEHGGPASIGPIHGPCGHTHTHTHWGITTHTHPLTCAPSLHCVQTHTFLVLTTGNPREVRAMVQLFAVLVIRVHSSGLLSHRGYVCVCVCGGEGGASVRPQIPQR